MDVFILRRAVLDPSLNVFGYELRHSPIESDANADPPLDSVLQLISNSLFAFDSDLLSAGKKLFYRFTPEALAAGCAELLPLEAAVIDLHPAMELDEDVARYCRTLRSAGYDLCAPVSSVDDLKNPVVELANLLSVDLSHCTDAKLRAGISAELGPEKQLIGRAVDTTAEFQQARSNGYRYFEGPFFWKPPAVVGSNLPVLEPNHLRLMQALSEPEPRFRTLADIIGHDPSLTYKLLRLVNSAACGLWTPVNSIERALIMVGTRGIRQLAFLAAVSGFAAQAPAELLTCSSIRGRFCQLIGEGLGLRDQTHELFLLGLFSLLDVITGRPLAMLLGSIHVEGPVREALEGNTGQLRDILDLVIAYEQAQWDRLREIASRLQVPTPRITPYYMAAVEWANVGLDACLGEAA